MGLHRSKTKSDAKRTLDEWFNRYIRLRDARPDGMVPCITCGKPYHHSEGRKINAGHFIESSIMATRYDEYNVNGQCAGCNNSDNGKQYEHGKAIKLKYGEEVPEELLEKSRSGANYSKEELMAMAREYKALCEQMKQEKLTQLSEN